eukprot:4076104-Prymnesium_polylepis.1
MRDACVCGVRRAARCVRHEACGRRHGMPLARRAWTATPGDGGAARHHAPHAGRRAQTQPRRARAR